MNTRVPSKVSRFFERRSQFRIKQNERARNAVATLLDLAPPTARVVRPDGSKLPNLFAGGGTACSISGNGVDGYLPAAGLGTAITLGRLAGVSAAALVAH